MTSRNSEKRRFAAVLKPLLLTGLVWSVTIMPGACTADAPRASLILSVLSLTAGSLGAVFAHTALGRVLEVPVFLLLAALTWATAPESLRPNQLDPVRGVIGAVAFATWAIAVGSPKASEPAEASPRPIVAENTPKDVVRAGLYLFAFVIVALAAFYFAFSTLDENRGLVAQAIAACLTASLFAAAGEFLGRSPHKTPGSAWLRSLLPSMLIALLLAVAFVLHRIL